MRDDHFEWDDHKAERNLRLHGVGFETACKVFKDCFAVEWTDQGQDSREDRFVILGMVDQRVLFVSYTMRGERIRIISARLAEAVERRRYYNDNQT